MTKSELETSKLDLLVAYGELGWKIFPCKPGEKVPACKWTEWATTDESKIIQHWTQYPEDNVGLACGAGSGVIVIDLDMGEDKNGIESMKQIERSHGETLPKTVVARTPRNGFHCFFKYPHDLKIKNQVGFLRKKGIDIRSEGGYVVLTPSSFVDSGSGFQGLYTWHPKGSPFEMPIADLPAWFLPLLEQKEPPDPPDSPMPAGEDSEGIIPEGKRDATLTKWAGAMRRQGMNAEEMYPSLMKINMARCQPPLPECEIVKICRSVAQYSSDPVEAQPIEGPSLPNPWGAEVGSALNTQQGNATRFEYQHRGEIRYVKEKNKFFVWDGKKWVVDLGECMVTSRIKETNDSLFRFALTETNDEKREIKVKWAHRSQTDSTARGMLSYFKGLPGVAASQEDFDKDLDLLNCANGIVDLRTGELVSHDPTKLMTMIAGTSYDPEMPIPHFEKFLHSVFEGNQELIDFIQMTLGYAATGRTDSRCLFIWYGYGANGKSCLMSIISEILGSYADKTNSETLLAKGKNGNNIPNDVADLNKKRFITTSETSDTRCLDEAKVKALTGGKDKIKARFLYEEYFSFRPTAKIFLGTNHLPQIHGQDHGIWSRIIKISFNHTFTPEDSVPESELLEPIMKEGPGILAWIVKGAMRWYEQKGFKNIPACVVVDTKDYRENEDFLSGFFDECCVVDPNAEVSTQKLFEGYSQWCERGHFEVLNLNSFAKQIANRKFTRIKLVEQNKKQVRGFRGLKLREPGTSADSQQEDTQVEIALILDEKNPADNVSPQKNLPVAEMQREEEPYKDPVEDIMDLLLRC